MCPKISRRSAPGFHQKQSKRSQNFQRYAPGEPCKWCENWPKMFRRYAPGDQPPDFPTHIKYVSTALFSSLAHLSACSRQLAVEARSAPPGATQS